LCPGAPGQYEVALTVSDGCSEHTTSTILTVEEDAIPPDGAQTPQPQADLTLEGFAAHHSAAAIVPIVLEQDVVAVMVLGKKKSGDGFTREDMKLLKTFAYQAAVAFSKAQLYAEAKEYSRTLEQKVKERTREIEQIQEDQKQMMVDISHNLQTPLTVVKDELGLLKKTLPDDKNLKTFERSIDSVSRFIANLLKLAKLEYGSDTLDMRPVDLSALLVELVEYFEVPASEDGITLTGDIEEGVNINGDREKLEELVTNLVSNAVKYAAKQKQIRIMLKRAGDQAELAVADTGIGIAPDELENIFKRFYRVRHETERGSGLGLAIAKRIVEMHHGTIEVESEVGKGTMFTIRLPIRRVEVDVFDKAVQMGILESDDPCHTPKNLP
jgi:signal transduction histidine kinase